MATRWAVATGNWSSTATWDGGTLPTSADDVYADGKTVTIDQDVTVLSLRTTARSGGSAGGSFVVSTTRTITASGAGLVPGSSTVLNANASPNITINGTVNGSSTTNAVVTVDYVSGTGTLTVNGNISSGSSNDTKNINAGSTSTVLITGNVTSYQGPAILMSGSSLTITGNVTAAGATGTDTFQSAVQVSGSTVVTIVGDVIGNTVGSASTANGVRSTSPGAITITGTVTGGSSAAGAHGVQVTAANASISVIGTVTGGIVASSYGVYASGASATVQVNGSVVGRGLLSHGVRCDATANGVIMTGNLEDSTQGAVAVYSRVFRLGATNSGITRHANTVNYPNGGLVSRVSPDNVTGMPAVANVRYATVYGYNSELTGTLRVPPVNSVASGVPVDNTVGTAALAPADVAALVGAQIAAALNSTP